LPAPRFQLSTEKHVFDPNLGGGSEKITLENGMSSVLFSEVCSISIFEADSNVV
jgi:hypothetical protein